MAKKEDYKWIIVLGTIISLGCFYSYFSRSEEFREKKRIEFNNYKVIESSKGSDFYFVYSKEEEFNIPSVIIGAFNNKDFLKEVKPKDSIVITLGEQKDIYQIEYKNKSYIDKDLRKNELGKNKLLALVIGIVFSLLALFSIIKLSNAKN